jgi:hypothetical protein
MERQMIQAHVAYTRAYGARCEHGLDPTAQDFPPGCLRAGLLLQRAALYDEHEISLSAH